MRTTSYALSTRIVLTHQPLSVRYRKVSVCLHQPSNYGRRMLRLWSKMKRIVLFWNRWKPTERPALARLTRCWHRKFPSVTVMLPSACSSRQAVTFQWANYTSDAQKLLVAMRDACTPGVVEFRRDNHHEFTELSVSCLSWSYKEWS